MKKTTVILGEIILGSMLFSHPTVKTGNAEIDNLVTLAQTEVQKNIRSDGTFCAGAQWPTAWTRDMSYAIDLSLSFLFPSVVEKSLDSRIENDSVLQDTGSGGSYPVSTDRITWITAAYDYSLVKQSEDYSKKVYKVAKITLEKDYNVNFDKTTGLFRGESSFLDWREQTYPRWATNEYIADSFALGTNMMYYSALQKAALLSKRIGNASDETEIWENRAASLKEAIMKNFWIPEKEYFAALLLNDIHTYKYQGYETLGESLGVILGVAPEESFRNVLGAVKPQEHGLSVVAPQLAGIPPYHNDGVWPFVQGYRGLACKKAGDAFNAKKEFSTMIEAAKKFGTFKENYVASNFTPDTQINSDRQLWSDAGFLSYIYRILFGISFTEKGIAIKPFNFELSNLSLTSLSLKDLEFAGGKLSIEVKGSGDTVKRYLLNGNEVPTDYIIPYGGSHGQKNYVVQIELEKSQKYIDSFAPEKQIEPWFDARIVTPAIPNVRVDADTKKTEISFKPKNKGGWKIAVNGKSKTTSENEISLKAGDKITLVNAFALLEKTAENVPLFPSKYARVENTKNTQFYEAEKAEMNGGKVEKERSYSFDEDENGKGAGRGNADGDVASGAKISEDLSKTEANCSSFVKDFGKNEGEYIEFTVNVKKEGDYAIDFRFKNGHGPINTGEKCAVLAVAKDGELLRRLAFPQQGSWASWNFTAPTVIHLEKGAHKIKLYTDDWCRTQHGSLNPVHIDLMRIARL
ncbi:MAG: hypothetical protein K6E78_05535 [Treponema sp.]|nr:hypothetical protein [Treponema sp.]